MFNGDQKTKVGRQAKGKSHSFADNLNGTVLSDMAIAGDNELVYLNLLPASRPTGSLRPGAVPVVQQAAAAAAGGAAAAAPPPPAQVTVQSSGNTSALPTQSEVDGMSCAQAQTVYNELQLNALAYQSPQATYIQWQQISSYLHTKITNCGGSGTGGVAGGSAVVQATAAAAAKAPVVSVVGSVSIQLPQNSVTIDASGSTDPQGQPLQYMWQLISGPNNPTISGSSVATISNLIAGTYTIQLTVTNNAGLTASQNITVNVQPAASTLEGVPVGNEPVTIATTAPVNLDSVSPYGGDLGGGGGGGGDTSGDGSTDTTAAGTTPGWWQQVPWWQWGLGAVIAAGALYIVFGGKKSE